MAQTAAKRESKQLAHELVDRLEPAQVPLVVRLLEKVVDPVAYALAHAPFDDEIPSEAEDRTAAASAEWLKHHEPIPHEDILKMLGLTPDDLERASAQTSEA